MLPQIATSRSSLSPRVADRLILQAVVSLLAALLFLSTDASAQERDEVEDVIRVRTDLVLVPVRVTDSKGRRVPDLEAHNFSLRTDHNPLRLDFFGAGTEQVALAFLLDASGSARDYLLQQREAAISLFSQYGMNSKVAVLPFADKIFADMFFTDDVEKARASFKFPSISNRRTAIFDSVMAGLDLFSKQKPPPIVRRIMILTSDGLDTSSTSRPERVIERAKLEGVSIYVIHFPIFSPISGRLSPRPATKGFRQLSEETGGRYFQMGDARSVLQPGFSPDLAPVFKAIEEDLASQYLLGFYPNEAIRDGSFHRLHVEVSVGARRKLNVKTLREGFILKERG